MQSRLALPHLQFPLHFFLHPHLISSLHALHACGKVVQNGDHISSSFLQPQSAGEGSSGLDTTAWPHTWPAWNAARLTCCVRAAFVGGIFSVNRLPEQNRLFLAPLTVERGEVRLYSRTTYHSISAI